MTEDEEAAEIIRRLSKTDQERMFEDLYKAIKELTVMFKSEHYVKKEDGDKETN